jgi:hypothetical protein
MSTQRASQLVEAGLWLKLSGDLGGARRMFEQALKLDPENVRAQELLGLAPPASPAAPAVTAWDADSNPGFRMPPPLPTSGRDVMDLVQENDQAAAKEKQSAAVAEEVETLLKGAKDLLDLDDHTGAMDLIVRAQQLAPEDPGVAKLRERSEQTLQTMYESKLGRLDAVPRVRLKEDEIIWLNLDHRAGFVLAQIDGAVTFEDVFAVSGMSRLDTARILAQLLDEGVIKPEP